MSLFDFLRNSICSLQLPCVGIILSNKAGFLRGLMKKWFLVLFLTFTCALEALPLGNPAETALFSENILFSSSFCELVNIGLRAGYYGDFVFDRKLHLRENRHIARDLIKTEISTNAGYLVLNLCDRHDIFCTLGATRISIEADQQVWREAPTAFAKNSFLTLKPGFSWSIGGRTVLYENAGFILGVEGQYFAAYPVIHKYQMFTFANPHYLHGEATYREGQLGAVLSYEIDTFSPDFSAIPYIGVKWARATLTSHNFTFNADTFEGFVPFTIFNTESVLSLGCPIGVTLLLNQSIDFTLEGRFGDEIAFSLFIQALF